jgi:hypothetical protein
MTNKIFRPNTYLFRGWLAVGLVIGLFMIVWPSMTYANGGTTLWVEKVGAYELTVAGFPFPLEVGVNNDISVLVGRLSDAQIVLDAQVTLTAEPVDRSSEPQTFSVTHANATNELYYSTNVVFPSPGQWQLTLQVDGPEDSVSTTFEVQVENTQSSGFTRYLSLIGLAAGLFVFLLAVVLSRNLRGTQEEGIDDIDE